MTSSVYDGKIMGLKLREWGQIGVKHMTWAALWTMEPPQLRLYAVLPAGVEIKTPSPCITVRRILFT